MRFWTSQVVGMTKSKTRFSRNRDFLGGAPSQTDIQRTVRPGCPLPHAGNLHPVGGLSPPHSNELCFCLANGVRFGPAFLHVQQSAHECGRRRRKKWYFIIFSLRICLGCARHGPCFVGSTGPGLGGGYPLLDPKLAGSSEMLKTVF